MAPTRRMGALALVMAALVLGLGACGGSAGGAGDLAGTWHLVELSAGDDSAEPVAGHPVTLQVAGTTVTGRSGCNSYSGTLASPTIWDVRDLTMTEMACEPAEVMQFEEAYLMALNTATAATVAGDDLVIAGAGPELRFTRAPAG